MEIEVVVESVDGTNESFWYMACNGSIKGIAEFGNVKNASVVKVGDHLRYNRNTGEFLLI